MTVKTGRYRHYKGNEYIVIGVARHSETDEELVVYQPDYGERGLWIRPKAMFLETVEVDGKSVPRFEFIGPDEGGQMTESTRDTLILLQQILLRCWLFGFLILFVWLGAILLFGDAVLAVHGTMFGITKHELQIINYCGMGLWKLSIIALFFFPWLSIRLVLKKSA